MPESRIFKRKLEFVYQSLFIYLIGFGLYLLLKGQVDGGSFTFIYKDPLVILFSVVLVFVIVYLLFSLFEQRQIVITDTSVSFKTRLKEYVFPFSDILYIKIGRPKHIRTPEEGKIIRIKTKNRRRVLIIRVMNYERSEDLRKEIIAIQQRIHTKHKV